MNRTGDADGAASIRSWSQDAATLPVQKARPHSGSNPRTVLGGSAGRGKTAASQAGSISGSGYDGAVPVPDAPLVTEVRAPQSEHAADGLADALAHRRFDLRR